tara:strand:- start:228555 stop:229925 length:1371 start_codon:yes stop_codon:yes gene_type:complete
MMRAFSLSELSAPLRGRLVGQDVTFNRVSTDTRSLAEGDLFVALSGDQFDGHHYLEQARAAGACAALVHGAMPSLDLPQMVVSDTQQALGLLGAYNRTLFDGALVAITGSSGKTTVKNMVHAVLSQRGKTLSTAGNFNNEIGVPLTLLRLTGDVEFAVVEMGAAGKGHIAWLCEIGRPSVSLLLNAMPAHLDGFGSVEDVAAAKGEIFDALDTGDVAVINADQPWADQWRSRAGNARIIDFGLQQPAAVTATAVQLHGLDGVTFTAITPAGEALVKLSMPGQHNVANALAAIAVGLACQLSLDEICAGLALAQPVSGRQRSERSASGAMVIDDCYNANPGSVKAAIDLLAQCPGRRSLLLGAMKELGERSVELHRETGAHAKSRGLEQLWGVGPELRDSVDAFGTGGRWFPDLDSLVAALPGSFGSDDTVLVKGSRSTRMEQALEVLLAAQAQGES